MDLGELSSLFISISLLKSSPGKKYTLEYNVKARVSVTNVLKFNFILILLLSLDDLE